MNIREEKKVTIEVEFYETITGWIKFKIKAGNQTFNGRFSEVFDPVIDFKKWLEAISIGVQQTSFEFDPEGDDIKFDFERVCWDREVFTISEPYVDGNIFIKAIIDRRQLIEAFYLSFYNFSNSERYNPKEWEIETYEERLCKFMSLNKYDLIENLAELKGYELSKLLFNIAPSYRVSFPKAKNKNEEFNLFVQSVAEGKKSTLNNDLVRTAITIDLPESYENLNMLERKEFIIEYLTINVSDYNGVKLSEFQSPILGKYLYDNE